MKYYTIPGIFLALTLFFAYLYVFGPSPKQPDYTIKEQSSDSMVPYDRLEQFRREAEVKRDIRDQEAQVRKYEARPELDPDFKNRNRFHDSPLYMEHGPASIELSNDGHAKPMNLDQRMDAFLAKRQQFEEMEAHKKQMFVDRFIQEAFDMGYHVEVDENLEVTEVRKID